MDKLLFQQLLTLICFSIYGWLIFTQPNEVGTWLGFVTTLTAYWLPSPSRGNDSP